MKLSDWLSKQEGLTQAAFADQVGCTQGRIAQIINGDLPSMHLAKRIRMATGGVVTPNDFAQTEAAE